MSTMTIRKFLATVGRWRKGRQGTGYEKMLLLTGSWPLGFDVYLLRYSAGQGIAPHRDPVKDARHYRANLVLLRGGGGGDFGCEKSIYSGKRLFVFRPDISTHWVQPVMSGTRVVLSLGWVRR